MSGGLSACVLVCTLSKSPTDSSTEALADEVISELEKAGVKCSSYRVVDYDVHFGVEADMGGGDEWPTIRASISKSDILLIATPIWMGQPSSVTKMVLERLDAELSETDTEGRPSMYGKVAGVAIVGNEDGAHHVSAEIYQALSDVGFTIPAGGPTYWVGEAMATTDYKDLDQTPAKTAQTTRTLSSNSIHLARLLQTNNYPATS